MKTYTIINSDIMYQGKVFPEGSTIELNDEEAQALSGFLIVSASIPSPVPDQKIITKNHKKVNK